MATDPFQLFDQWLAEARVGERNDPEAMAIATATSDGQPSVRMVLLKGHGPDGFVFYTNEQSPKGDQLAANANAALLFHWKSLRRQVRIEGWVERVGNEQADAYFASRARDFSTWRMGFGSIPATRQPGDLRAAVRGGEAPIRGRGGAAAAALGRLPRRARTNRILERPPAPAS